MCVFRAALDGSEFRVLKQNQKVNMSDINSSLIGFLKKKSLFSPSPEKSLKNRERSKEKRELLNSSSRTPRNAPERNPALYPSESTRNLKKNSSVQQIEHDILSDTGNSFVEMERSPIRFQQTTSAYEAEKKSPKRTFNFRNPQDNSKGPSKPTESDNITSLWTGLVNYSTSFQSARLESMQCLDGLSVKIHSEISNINYKIQVFQSKMTKILNNQFAGLQEKIYSIVNRVFEQSEKSIKQYIKQQEGILAKQLIAMRIELSKQYEKIEIMRQEINKPNWKKVAGELLSSDLETKVEDLLSRSKSIDVGHWEMGDFGQKKVQHLEEELRDMVRLQVR